jgi:uncharacterized protein (TIRG00374 family)
VAVVVAIFAFALPQVADYSAAWALVRAMSVTETTVLVIVALLNLVSYSALWVAAMPGLSWRRAVMVEEASTAVSNTVPVGFAFGVGTIAAMYTSFGYSPGVITRAVGVTGVWNNLVKLAVPVLALTALALTGERTGALGVAAVTGLCVLVTAVLLLVLAVVHHGTARALGRTAQRALAPLLRRLHHPVSSDWGEGADRFRADSEELLRARWPALTAAALVSHGLLFLVLLASVHFVHGLDDDTSWARVLAVYAVTRLVTIVPITPGAVGVAELSYVAGLVAVGVDAVAATGAVLVFRFLTWFLPIPIGAACWLLWRRSVGPHAAAPAAAPRRTTGAGR